MPTNRPKRPRGHAFPKGNKFGKKFQPGVSGNPRGRPKAVEDLVEDARSRAPGLLEMLEKVALGQIEASSAQVAAARDLLDRGMGRPPQSVPVKGDLDHLSDAQISEGFEQAKKDSA